MSTRRPLTRVALTGENQLDVLNREIVPFIRQLDGQVRNPTKAFTGSRATFTAFELQVLSILVAAGIAVDSTTP